MQTSYSAEELAQHVHDWCQAHGVKPASGQAGERLTERNVRYYRTLGLLDPPITGGGQGYGEKHRLQLVALRLLQAQGLPLNRIRELLLGRTEAELRQIEQRGLEELKPNLALGFRAEAGETWAVTPLDEEFLIISRRGRGISAELRERLLEVLHPGNKARDGASKGRA